MNLVMFLYDGTDRTFSGISIARAMKLLEFYGARVKNFTLSGALK